VHHPSSQPLLHLTAVTGYDSGRWLIVTKTEADEPVIDEEAQKLLKEVVSRLGLEPRALALEAQMDRY
jgi:hypothetical protein